MEWWTARRRRAISPLRDPPPLHYSITPSLRLGPSLARVRGGGGRRTGDDGAPSPPAGGHPHRQHLDALPAGGDRGGGRVRPRGGGAGFRAGVPEFRLVLRRAAP